MTIERITALDVPAHVRGIIPIQTGVNSDTDTGAAILPTATGDGVYVLVRVSESPLWYHADTMAAAADFFGRLMSTDTAPDVLAQRVAEDETMCPVCGGIVANGAELVPEDGTPCTCVSADPETARFWTLNADPDVPEHRGGMRAFGADAVGIVDERAGGVIAWTSPQNARMIFDALTDEPLYQRLIDAAADLHYGGDLEDSDRGYLRGQVELIVNLSADRFADPGGDARDIVEADIRARLAYLNTPEA